MTSMFTFSSAPSDASQYSPDFYTRLKSLLPSTTSPSILASSGSAPPSFSEWKRKVRCVNESDYATLPKLESSHYRDTFSRDFNFVKGSNQTASIHPNDIGPPYPLINLFSSHNQDDSERCLFSLKSAEEEIKTSSSEEISTFSHQLTRCPETPSSEFSGKLSKSLAVISSAGLQTPKNGINAGLAKNFSSVSARGSISAGDSATNSSRNTCKKNVSGHRKNIWKNQTYADLICKAILSSPGKRLTLSQIYDWLIENIDYFKAKKDGKSSVGWKNSIRHNLSLHSRFVRIQGHESGKSSWWTVDLTAKSSRRCKRKPPHLDLSKTDHRMPTATTTAFCGTHLPTFFRHQTHYDSYPVDDQFHSQNSFYQQGKEGWLRGYTNKSDLSFSTHNNEKSSFSPSYFPYTDPYSGCSYSTSFLPTSFASSVDSNGYSVGLSSIDYGHNPDKAVRDSRVANDGGRYFASNALSHYDDYFYLKNSTPLQFSDPSASLPAIGARNSSIEGKALPSLFSSLRSNIDNFRGFRSQGDLDYLDASGYNSSRYDRRVQQTVPSEERIMATSYNLKKPHLHESYAEGMKVNIVESDLRVT